MKFLPVLILSWIINVSPLDEPTGKEKKEICFEEYTELGCFDLDPPWTNFRRHLPEPHPPEKTDPKFYLVTRNTVSKSDVEDWRIPCTKYYQPNLESLQKLDYKHERERTVLLIHGKYIGYEWNWNMLRSLAETYLTRRNVNVIILKYESGDNIRYDQLVANIRVVAAIAAKFIEQLMQLVALEAKKIHIIGVSLGGHTAGYIGKRIPNIDRITGLDIAGPFFRHADPKYRLHKDDAKHIDILHTDTLRVIGLGYGPPIGKVDFYFYGGSVQPECKKYFKNVSKNMLKLNFEFPIAFGGESYLPGACSHVKAIEYWVNSVQNFDGLMFGIAPESRSSVKNRSALPKWSKETQINCVKPSKNCIPVGLDTFDYAESGIYYVHRETNSPDSTSNHNSEKKIKMSNTNL